MIKPTINDLSQGKYNRYEVALATAKCARMITNEYVRQRMEAETAANSKDNDKPLNALIDREVRDEKAVKIAINRIHEGKYQIVHKDPDEQAQAEMEILKGTADRQRDLYDDVVLSDDEDALDDESMDNMDDASDEFDDDADIEN